MGLGGAALVLQGCGGGSGGGDKPVTDKCVNQHLDLVSQSSTGGSITGSVQGNMGGTDVDVSMQMNTVQKIDLEKFNLRMDITSGTASGKMPGTDKKVSVKMQVQVIVNAANKEVVAKYDIEPDASTGMPAMKNCTKITDEKIPSPATIAQIFALAKTEFQTFSTCGGNDGTNDIWKLAYPSPGMPNLPLPKGDSVKLESVFKMNKDFLISEVSENIQASGKDPNSGSSVSTTIDIDAKYDGSTAGGPSDSDMDYSGWGTCYPMTPPGDAINTIFQPQDKTAVTDVIDKVVLESTLRRIFLGSLHNKPKSEDKHVVV